MFDQNGAMKTNGDGMFDEAIEPCVWWNKQCTNKEYKSNTINVRSKDSEAENKIKNENNFVPDDTTN